MKRFTIVLFVLAVTFAASAVSADLDPGDPGGGGGATYSPVCWATGDILDPAQNAVYTANIDGYATVYASCINLGVGITSGQPHRSYQIIYQLKFDLSNTDQVDDPGPVNWYEYENIFPQYTITLDNTGKWTRMADQDGNQDGVVLLANTFFVFANNHQDLHGVDLLSDIDIISNQYTPYYSAYRSQSVGFYVVRHP